MKIYATIYNLIRPDSEFLGKDIWVRCVLFPKTSPTPGYARFLTLIDATVVCNFLSDWELSSDSYYTDRGKCTQALVSKRISTDNIYIYTPVETCTTQELLPEYESNSTNIFETFVGQDVWIRARAKNTFYESYIKVIAIKDNYMKFQEIGVEYVYVEDTYALEQRPTDCLLHFPGIRHLDYWELCEPLDILTDEEMREILEYNDKTYWEPTLGEDREE